MDSEGENQSSVDLFSQTDVTTSGHGMIPDAVTINYISFNQDFTGFSLATPKEYHIYDIGKDDAIFHSMRIAVPSCSIVERLYGSSFVTSVSGDIPRQLCVDHYKKRTNIVKYTYNTVIVAVKLNRQRLVVIFEENIAIHKVSDMELFHNISDSPRNVDGICDLSNNEKKCYLAYPASSSTGSLHIFDVFNLKSVVQIQAHDSPLRCIAFSDDGSMLATASLKGTVLRVFNVDDGSRLCELRRGMSRQVTMHSLIFSLNGRFLVCSSNTSTVHIFKVFKEEDEKTPPPAPAAAASLYSYSTSYLTSAVSMGAQYIPASIIPASVTDIMQQDRAFATATLPTEGHLTRLALTKTNILMVASITGMIFMFKFDPEAGGVCPLVKQKNLGPRLNETGTVNTLNQYTGKHVAESLQQSANSAEKMGLSEAEE